MRLHLEISQMLHASFTRPRGLREQNRVDRSGQTSDSVTDVCTWATYVTSRRLCVKPHAKSTAPSRKHA